MKKNQYIKNEKLFIPIEIPYTKLTKYGIQALHIAYNQVQIFIWVWLGIRNENIFITLIALFPMIFPLDFLRFLKHENDKERKN